MPPPAAAGPAPAPAPLTLVTWDIDGTLLRATGRDANALHRAAFTSAWSAVLGRALDLRDVPHQGSTDPLILIRGALHAGLATSAAELIGSAGAPAAAAANDDNKHSPCPPTSDPASPLAAMVAEMVRCFEAAPAGSVAEGLELLPGVAALLEALAARSDVLVGVVSGNLAPVAAAKIGALGVGRHFTPGGGGGGGGGGGASTAGRGAAPALLGGFGSDHCSGAWEEPWRDRAVLIRLAAARAQAAAGGGGRLVERVVHLGDTPYDCMAALGAGAAAVGVCTGVHSRAELEAVGGGGGGGGSGSGGGRVVVLDDLSDTPAALAALGLG